MSLTQKIKQLENILKIKGMAKFNDDWNGNGASAFSSEEIELFKNIINNLICQPEIAPTGRNSLYLEYRFDDDNLLVFEVKKNKTEMAFVPYGNFKLAHIESFDKDIAQNINQHYIMTSIMFSEC